MYENMMKDPQVLVKTNEEGLNLVKSGEYAYFMESTTIEYKTERDCDVARVGELLDSKGYGIAMRKGAYHVLWSSYLFVTKLMTYDSIRNLNIHSIKKMFQVKFRSYSSVKVHHVKSF